MAQSPSLTSRMKDFANKISGTSYVDNGTDPTSAAYKMKQSIGKPNPNAPKKFVPKPTSNGVGVGP